MGVERESALKDGSLLSELLTMDRVLVKIPRLIRVSTLFSRPGM